MHTPDFWFDPGHPKARRLRPLGEIYMAVTALRRALARPRRMNIPVICVGNIVAGGAGKTPLTMYLAHQLSQRGHQPYILTRGYGGKLAGPLRVDPLTHTAQDVGDEALLLARHAPTILSRQRYPGARLAQGQGATHILMDDGLQNFALRQDVRLLVLEGAGGLGNGYGVPAGPLRETLAAALPQASAVVLMGEDAQNLAARCRALRPDIPIHKIRRCVSVARAADDSPAVAFCGLARPHPFFKHCEELGFILAERIAFPDHHAFSEDDIRLVMQKAIPIAARVLTTEKDYVRVPHRLRKFVEIVQLTLEPEDEAALLSSVLTT